MSFIYILALCALWEQHDRTEGNSSLPLKRGIFYTGIVMCWFWGFGMPLSLNPMRALVPIIVTPTHNNYNNNNDLPIDTPSVWDDQWVIFITAAWNIHLNNVIVLDLLGGAHFRITDCLCLLQTDEIFATEDQTLRVNQVVSCLYSIARFNNILSIPMLIIYLHTNPVFNCNYYRNCI